MPVCDRAAGTLQYDVVGRGEPVLLLPGLGVGGNAWDYQTAALRERCRVITLDLRGSGGSVAADGDYSLGAMARDAVDLLDHLEVATASVVGMSLGGMVAQVLAADYPNRVNQLLLLTTAARPDARAVALLERLEHTARAEGVLPCLEQLLHQCFTPQFLAEQAPLVAGLRRRLAETPPPLDGLLGHLATVRACNTEPLLPKIHVPAVVFGAEADEVFPMEHSTALAAALPDAVLRTLPGGHACCVEAHAAVSRALAENLFSP